jgi:hypothetical protein
MSKWRYATFPLPGLPRTPPSLLTFSLKQSAHYGTKRRRPEYFDVNMGQKRNKISHGPESSLERRRIGPGSRGDDFQGFPFLQAVASPFVNYSGPQPNLNDVGRGHPGDWGQIAPFLSQPGNPPEQQLVNQEHNRLAENMEQFESEYVLIPSNFVDNFDFQDPLNNQIGLLAAPEVSGPPSSSDYGIVADYDTEEHTRGQQSRLQESSSDSASSTDLETEENGHPHVARQNAGKGQSSAKDADGSNHSLVKKQKARGPFQSVEDREETSQNRRDRVCLRCRAQHLRVSPWMNCTPQHH